MSDTDPMRTTDERCAPLLLPEPLAPDTLFGDALYAEMIATLTPREGGMWVLVRNIVGTDDGLEVFGIYPEPVDALPVISEEIARELAGGPPSKPSITQVGDAWEFEVDGHVLRLQWAPIEPATFTRPGPEVER